MIYWHLVNSYWKNWHETLAGVASDSDVPPPSTPSLSACEKYDYLTEYGTQILCMLSVDGGCNYLSRNFETITGYSLDAQNGNGFFALLHPDYRTRLQALLKYTPEGPASLQCKLQYADKKYYWHLLTLHPKSDAPGDYVCIIENIHATMQVQATLQKARLEAELALRTRSEFLANMSHELRTPLNAVIGFSQIIESEIFGKVENPQYREYVKHIQESGYDLLGKIEDLLEIANIDAGRVTLEKEEVYLSELVKHVIESQAHHAASAKVTLEYTPKDDILLFVDRLKLQHLLGHLLANAIKFSHEGGIVGLEVMQGAKGRLLFSVRDQGVGMTEAKLVSVTGALHEDNCWTAKDAHSIGIGLALTREFVALHGGELTVESKVGVGTTIRIALPKECVHIAKQPALLRQVTG